MKKLKIFLILAILGSSTITYGQSPQARDHAKMQQQTSYQTWRNNQPKVRISAVKSTVKQSKEMYSEKNRLSRLKRKEIKIRKQIIK